MDAFLDYNGDLVITPNGSIAVAVDWDEIRQRIIRRFLTNSSVPLPDGTITPPDYIFDAAYGLSAGALIDQNPSQQWLRALKGRVRAAVLQDVAVDPGSTPSINITTPTVGTLLISITVRLANGSTGTVTLSAGTSAPA